MEKTIKASIIGLTKIKRQLLDFDYSNYQWWMIFGIDNGLLSGFKAAKGYKQKVIKYRDYPLPLDSRPYRQCRQECCIQYRKMGSQLYVGIRGIRLCPEAAH